MGRGAGPFVEPIDPEDAQMGTNKDTFWCLPQALTFLDIPTPRLSHLDGIEIMQIPVLLMHHRLYS